MGKKSSKCASKLLGYGSEPALAWQRDLGTTGADNGSQGVAVVETARPRSTSNTTSLSLGGNVQRNRQSVAFARVADVVI